MSSLTLPGTIPGLLRRGSPVLFRGSVYEGTVIETNGGGEPYVVGGYMGGEYQAYEYERGEFISLDLADATGRAHAAWWLAASMYPECPPTDGVAVAWQLFPGQQPNSGWWLRYCARGANSASTTVAPTFSGHWSPRMWAQHIHALADLDPNDPRTLPDGSRHVDALALQLVCLHVAGLPEEG